VDAWQGCSSGLDINQSMSCTLNGQKKADEMKGCVAPDIPRHEHALDDRFEVYTPPCFVATSSGIGVHIYLLSRVEERSEALRGGREVISHEH
jgi:hypothetical protein